jgi:uncharacterized protein (TIGR02246 family)
MSNIVPLASGVTEVLKRYRDTVFAKDTEAHLALYDENALLFDAWDKWSLRGINELQGMITEWFDSLGTDRVVVEMEDVHVLENGNLGYASAITKYRAISPDGQTLRWLQNRFTSMLEARDGVWKIVHQHTSGPAHSETLKISLRRSNN